MEELKEVENMFRETMHSQEKNILEASEGVAS